MNKLGNSETNLQQESLADLPLTDEQAEETKAVSGGRSAQQTDEFGSTFTDGVFTRADG